MEYKFIKVKDGTTEIYYSVEGAWKATLRNQNSNFEKAKTAFLKTYGYEVIEMKKG